VDDAGVASLSATLAAMTPQRNTGLLRVAVIPMTGGHVKDALGVRYYALVNDDLSRVRCR
jgi:hypothetical protein